MHYLRYLRDGLIGEEGGGGGGLRHRPPASTSIHPTPSTTHPIPYSTAIASISAPVYHPIL